MTDPKPCWECLKRRLACDCTRPACRKCRLRGTECPGYQTKPLKWLEPGQTRSKGRRAKTESNIIRLSMPDRSEASTVLEAIKYYNHHICPDMEAIGPAGVSKSPFFVNFATASNLPASIRHTMVSIALAHRILQFEQGFEADRAALSARLQTHRGGAIRELAQEVKACSQTNLVTLASVLTFLFAELQQCLSPNWRHHCDAAHAILDMLGGLPMLILSQPALHHFLRYFVLIEVIGTTTSPSIEPDKARRQLELVSLVPMLFGNGLCTSLPCPPELLQYIILINYWRSQTSEPNSDRNPQTASPLELLNRVASFSVEGWVKQLKLKQRASGSPDDEVLESWDWQKITHIYQSSVTLYCISSLFASDNLQLSLSSNVGAVDIETLKRVNRDALFSNLEALSSPSQMPLRKLVLWPLMIAGIELDATDYSSKKFIISELNWMSKTLGTASPLMAKDFLERLWANGAGRPWNELFDRCYVCAM